MRWLALTLLMAVLASCTSSGGPTPPPTPSGSGKTGGCGVATATIATDRSVPVDSLSAPTVGPYSFHPYPYAPGYPTKVLIHAFRAQRGPISLRGFRCSDGRPLRFWYERGSLPEQPPMTTQEMQSAGDAVATLEPIPKGTDHTGYMLFSSPGEWVIRVSAEGSSLGHLVVNVVS